MSAPRLCIIGCGAAKLGVAAPARELYTGPLFRDALGYATHPGRFDEVRILSAKHGLLRLDQVVEPYELWLGDLSLGETRRLGDSVGEQLGAIWGATPPHTIAVLAGEPYVRLVHRALDAQGVHPRPCVMNLLKGLTQGARRAWFKREREAAQ